MEIPCPDKKRLMMVIPAAKIASRGFAQNSGCGVEVLIPQEHIILFGAASEALGFLAYMGYEFANSQEAKKKKAPANDSAYNRGRNCEKFRWQHHNHSPPYQREAMRCAELCAYTLTTSRV